MQHHARRLPYGQLLGFARILLLSISISSATSVANTVTHTQMQTLTLSRRSVTATTSETRRQTQTLSSRSAPCQLNCANGGYCEYIGTDEAKLAHDIQSGHLVQKCVCLPGFVGMGCEVPSPCGEQEQQDTRCDYCTIIADEMSKFAGMMCRKPFTEYCNAATATTDFCTNGGKCMASFVAAHFAPGNTTANSQFAGLGCICNPAFYGPHCELLKLPHHADDNQILLDTEKFTTTSGASSTSNTTSTSEATRDSESDTNSISDTNTNSISDNTNNSLDFTSVFSVTVLVASVASFLAIVVGAVTIRRYRDLLAARRRHHGYVMPASSGIMRGGGSGESAAEFAPLTRAGRNII